MKQLCIGSGSHSVVTDRFSVSSYRLGIRVGILAGVYAEVSPYLVRILLCRSEFVHRIILYRRVKVICFPLLYNLQ